MAGEELFGQYITEIVAANPEFATTLSTTVADTATTAASTADMSAVATDVTAGGTTKPESNYEAEIFTRNDISSEVTPEGSTAEASTTDNDTVV
jgi:hypothetical protein